LTKKRRSAVKLETRQEGRDSKRRSGRSARPKFTNGDDEKTAQKEGPRQWRSSEERLCISIVKRGRRLVAVQERKAKHNKNNKKKSLKSKSSGRIHVLVKEDRDFREKEKGGRKSTFAARRIVDATKRGQKKGVRTEILEKTVPLNT